MPTVYKFSGIWGQLRDRLMWSLIRRTFGALICV